MAKTLVAYFSASGQTGKLAEKIAKAAGADLFEIRPEVPYTKADLNWMNKKSRSSVEMNDRSSRPAIAGTAENIAQYDRVLLGFPIWWYTAPTIIDTFLESCDMTGKEIILFATSGGSGFGDAAERLQKAAPGAVVKEGKLLNHASDKAVEEFLAGLN